MRFVKWHKTNEHKHLIKLLFQHFTEWAFGNIEDVQRGGGVCQILTYLCTVTFCLGNHNLKDYQNV